MKHFDPETMGRHDTVIGAMPIHHVATISARGAHFLPLVLIRLLLVSACELTKDDLDAAGASLHAYHAAPFRRSASQWLTMGSMELKDHTSRPCISVAAQPVI